MRFAGVSLQSAVDMASRHPAQILGLDVCDLGAGECADFILLTEQPSDPTNEFEVITSRDLLNGTRGQTASAG